MADACVFLLTLPQSRYAELVSPKMLPLVNIGAGKDLSIRELAELVCEIVGFHGRLEFDASKPDGTPRKLMDTSRLERLGWRAGSSLRDGVRMAYDDFKTTLEQPLRAAQ
jgi:GDP-L-fucose synthase